MVEFYNRQIEDLQAREVDEEEDDIGEAAGELKETQRLLDKEMKAIEALESSTTKSRSSGANPASAS